MGNCGILKTVIYMNYNIEYAILNYDKYHSRLQKLLENNSANKFPVTKQPDIAQSPCGFPVEHYTIGSGDKHLIIMGGTHGNEIISVDFVTQLMKNIAEGRGDYNNLDLNKITLDFIPCQNPEGFYITTYALDSKMKNMTEEEIEKFSKEYYQAYRNDNIDVHNNRVQGNPENHGPKKRYAIFNDVTPDCIPEIDKAHQKLKAAVIKLYSDNHFENGTMANFFANSEGVNLNDNNENFFHIFNERIKENGPQYGNMGDNGVLKSVPGPIGMPSKSLDHFEYALENQGLIELVNNLSKEDKLLGLLTYHGTGGMVFANPVDEQENVLYHTELNGKPIDPRRLNKLGENSELTTVFDTDQSIDRSFKFLINRILASKYTSTVDNVYNEKSLLKTLNNAKNMIELASQALNNLNIPKNVKEVTDPNIQIIVTNINNHLAELMYALENNNLKQIKHFESQLTNELLKLNPNLEKDLKSLQIGNLSTYPITSYPKQITGVGDLLRNLYPGTLLIELSKMGGNPIAPYGDRQGNYETTIDANLRAVRETIGTAIDISYLYDTNYEINTGKTK